MFDPEYMIEQLRLACELAVADGHVGLWATGDMAWEFGPDKDFSKLLEYERALERLFVDPSDAAGSMSVPRRYTARTCR